MCVCSLEYPPCNAHAPYCHLRPARLYSIFPHYLINSTVFEKKELLNIKYILIFSTTCVLNISHSKKNSARYYHKSVLIFTYSACYSCKILMQIEFSRHIVDKYTKIKFHENPSSGRRVAPCGRTDMAKLIVGIHNFANAPKTIFNAIFSCTPRAFL